MEHREKYDPEDIEHLLGERSFDALLPEERAYVLRHLSDREEYEAMRSTLLQLREGDHRHDPISPDPDVRVQVLRAFRAQASPSWKIHLNALGAWFFPPDARAVLRPALVLGGLALLVVSVMLLVGSPAGDAGQLAELRGTKPAGPVQQEEATSELGTATQLDESVNEQEPSSENEVVGTELAAKAEMPEERYAELEDREMSADVMESIQLDATAMSPEVDQEISAAPILQDTDDDIATLRSVGADELSRNMTLANTEGVATRSRKAMAQGRSALAAASSRTLEQDRNLLDLLTAAW